MSSNGSTGQILGYIVGAVVGYFTGGTGWALVGNIASGAATGGAIGGMLDPPKGPTLVGPRLGDLSVQSATYGAHIPRIYGAVATYGNIFWLEGDRLKETLTKKKQGGKGGGGSTVKTYSYSATFAVGLCEGPIAGVRRIWVGAKLIYDAGAGDLESVIASNQAAQAFRVYLGKEDQQPDPRMQADKGVANTPAYRGLAYIVLYDYQLKDHGNSLMGAQVKVEVLAAQSVTPEVISLVESANTWNNTAAGQVCACAPLDERAFGTFHVRINDPIQARLPHLLELRPDGRLTVTQTALPPEFPAGKIITTLESCCLTSYQFAATHDQALGQDFSVTVSGGGSGFATVLGVYRPTCLSEKNGVIWIVAKNSLIGPSVLIYKWVPPTSAPSFSFTYGTADVPTIAALDDGGAVTMHRTNPGQFVMRKYDEAGGLVASASIPVGANNFAINDLRASFVDGKYFYVVANLSPITNKVINILRFDVELMSYVDRTDVAVNFSGLGGSGKSLYINGRIGAFAAANSNSGISQAVFNFGRVSSSAVPLSDIASAEMLASGLTPADIDVTALTDEVRGYRVTQTGAIRAAIEPLQSAWPFDVIQSGYKIKAVKRGGATVATIPAELLDARAAGEAPGPQITIVREMDTQLPRRVSIKHMDIAREYDIGEQYAERGGGDSISIREMEMPIVFNGAEAAQKAEVLLYLYWLERHTIQFKLPPEYLGLQPADVITITATDATYELRLTNINYLSDGRLECVARYNSAAIYTSPATGESSAVVGGVVGLDGPSKYELLDIPALRSEMDAPMFVAAMTGYTAAWPGGILYRSSDGGQSWDDLQGWTGKSTMGSARNAIAAHPGSVIDAASVLQVDLLAGELESVTELAMLNGSNYFAYGAHGRWEIVAAKNCVVQGDGSYYLTDLLRGRFGTERNTGNHAAGDAVVLLNDPDLALIGMDSASIGLERSYRGITAGRALDSDADRAFTYSGVNLECLSPVYLNGNRHPSTNDWTLTWIRRTRIGGEWRDLIDAPLSEATEAYEIEIYSSAAYTALKRTLTSTAPTAAYTSAQQVTDFGSNQTTLYLRIYQLSATVGRGFPLQATITR